MNPMVIRIAADLKEFRANMAEMKVQLETNASAMKRMSSAFDGSKIIGDANAMAKAIGNMGKQADGTYSIIAGAAKLSEAEQQRVNRAVTEAIEKYKLLGRQAPKELLELRDATNKVATATTGVHAPVDSLATKMRGLAGMMGVAFGATAVVAGIKRLVSSTFEYAETIKDTSAKMGVSMEATQRWKFAAEQTGASLENVSKSVLNLSRGIDGDDKSLRAALLAAGVQMDSLKGKTPEEAFNVIAAAIAKIPDPMTQARVAFEAFGKAGVELLPALREGFIDLADGASTMSDETIKALDAAKDRWDRIGNDIVVSSGQALGALSRYGVGASQVMNYLITGMTQGREAAAQFWAAQQDLNRTAEGMTQTLTATQQATIKSYGAMKGAKVSVGELAASMGLAQVAVQKYLDSLKPVPKAHKDNSDSSDAAAKAAKRLAEAFQKNVDQWTGAAAKQGLEDLRKVIDAAGGTAHLTAGKYADLTKQLDTLRDSGGVLTGEFKEIMRVHDIWNPSVKATTAAYRELLALLPGIKLDRPAPMAIPVSIGPIDITKLGKQLGALKLPPEIVTFGDKIKASLAKSLENIGTTIVGAIQGGGNVGRAIFASIGASLGNDLGASITKGMTKTLADGTKAAAGSFAKMIGGLAGPLWALAGNLLGGTLDKLFGKNQGRDDAKAFAAQFGGFDALRQKMLELEGGGEKLWIALTQNTKGPADVAKAIKAIEDAFAAAAAKGKGLEDSLATMRSRLAELQATSEPTFKDMEAAATRLGVSFDKLGPIFQQQKLTAEATEVWNALDTLRRGGADMNLVLADSVDEINAIVSASMKYGTVIPENFKASLEAMIANGQLLDANGEKMADLTGLKFGQAVKSQWEMIGDEISKLTKAIADLVAQMGGKLVGAVGDAVNAFKQLPHEWDFDIKPHLGLGSNAPAYGGGMASGGSGVVTRPTMFMAGEAGPESYNFTPLSSSSGGRNAQPIVINVNTNLDGRQVARNQVKYIPRELDFIGARR